MLSYNEIKERKYIIFEGEPYEVLSSHVFRKQQRKPVNQTKLRNLLNGRVVEQSFHVSDKVDEADMGSRDIKYLYNKPGRGGSDDEYWFADPANPSDRFMLETGLVGNMPDYIRQNDTVNALIFDDEVVGIKLPMKVDLRVTEAPPAVKGGTATGGDKLVTTETGLKVTTPLFINVGDTIRVKTDDGSYSERVEKA